MGRVFASPEAARRGWLGTLTVLATTATLLGPLSAGAGAATPDWHTIWSPAGTALPKTPSVKGTDAPRAAVVKPHPRVPSTWAGPAAASSPDGSATTVLTTSAPFVRSQPTQAGRLPVWLTPLAPASKPGTAQKRSEAALPASTRSEVKVAIATPAIARAAGIPGPLVTLQRSDDSPTGKIAVGIGAEQLDAAYGADAATRAHLVSLPARALTTWQAKSRTQQTPVGSARWRGRRGVLRKTPCAAAPGRASVRWELPDGRAEAADFHPAVSRSWDGRPVAQRCGHSVGGWFGGGGACGAGGAG